MAHSFPSVSVFGELRETGYAADLVDGRKIVRHKMPDLSMVFLIISDE